MMEGPKSSENSLALHDGTQVHSYSWAPANVRMSLCIVHGLGEYGGRYARTARFLNQNEVAVLTCDLPGHGKTQGARGDIRSFSQLDQIIEAMVRRAEINWPGKPIFIWGHSMGGNILLGSNYRKRIEAIKGMIISGAWIKTSSDPPRFIVFLSGMISHLLPGLILSNQLNLDGISSDGKEVSLYKADPMIHRKISLRTARLMFATAYDLQTTSVHPGVPCLVMHGDSDTITLPEGSKIFCANAGVLQLILWKGKRHELHHEFGREDVLNEMIEWMHVHSS